MPEQQTRGVNEHLRHQNKMARLRNHYDNLQVTRTASTEVIRASYRVLSQKYHPDKHGTNHSSEHRMKIINQAYAVLSDPEKRRLHDAWIAQAEAVHLEPEQEQKSKSEPTNKKPEEQHDRYSPPVKSAQARVFTKQIQTYSSWGGAARKLVAFVFLAFWIYVFLVVLSTIHKS